MNESIASFSRISGIKTPRFSFTDIKKIFVGTVFNQLIADRCLRKVFPDTSKYSLKFYLQFNLGTSQI